MPFISSDQGGGDAPSVMRVAVIGAGAAGLCALRHLNEASTTSINIKAVAYELATKMGGTWVYTDKVGKDKNGLPIHSSMYKNLKTNLPKECMGFPDYPFTKSSTSFVSHETVQQYLEDYTSHYDLSKYITYQTQVKYVQPIPEPNSKFGVTWEVTTSNVQSQNITEKRIFDAVLLCNGHFSVPRIPDIPGLDTFTGYAFHSHIYREPSPFTDKTVLVLGANSSGQDIGLELSTVAKKVYLCHNKSPMPCPLPPNMEQRPGIQSISQSKITLLDGSQVTADVLIYCTGYHYDFSFLSPECRVQVDDDRVTPLYKHFIHTKYPTFGIVGITKVIVPFPFFDVQARFFRAILDGTVTLPSEEEMNADTEADYQQRLQEGMPHRHAHVMGPRQFVYHDELVRMFNGTPVPKSVKILYNICHDSRRTNLMGYKSICFKVNEARDQVEILRS